MEDKDQWVGVAPCVRAGIRSLLRRFEDQQAALDEAAKSQAALLNAHARSEARCEALEAQIVAARREPPEARRIAAESSANVASLAADLAKRPARDEVEARASRPSRRPQRTPTRPSPRPRTASRNGATTTRASSSPSSRTSRDRATREETRQAISKAQETARSRGAAAAAALRKSLDSKFKAEALAREEEKRRLERRCDVLSREADALHKAYELLRDVGAGVPLAWECRGDGVKIGRRESGAQRGTDHGATTQEVRQNVREGCEFAVGVGERRSG